MEGLLRSDQAARSAARRDEEAIREASTALGFDFAYPLVSGLLRAYRLTSVLEFGCGRLAHLKYLRDRNGIKGWGLEIDSRIAAASTRDLQGTAYEGVLQVIEGDALSPGSVILPAGRIEAVVAVDLLHFYLRDRERVLAALAGWREKLPEAFFIIVEICRGPGRRAGRSPLPKAEYNLCHRLTGQALPAERDWLELFEAAGYRSVRKFVFPSLEHGAFVFRSAS